jgi:hypothetical protein
MKQLTIQELKAAGFEFVGVWGSPDVPGSRAPVPPAHLPGKPVTYVFVVDGLAVFAGRSDKGLDARMSNWRTNRHKKSCYEHLRQAVEAGAQVGIWYHHDKPLVTLKHQFARPQWNRQWPRD